jgi:hypothetical protein
LIKFTPSITLSYTSSLLSWTNFKWISLFYFHTCVWSASIMFTAPLTISFLPLRSCWFPPPNSPPVFHSFFFFLRSKFCIWERTCDIYLSGSGLFLLKWWSLVPSIFLQKWCNFIILYHWIILHCIYVTHFLHPFINWWASGLIP